MGIAMAMNLQNHVKAQGLPSLHYSNRSLSRGEPLKATGAVEEKTFEDLLRAVDIVFTMVSLCWQPSGKHEALVNPGGGYLEEPSPLIRPLY